MLPGTIICLIYSVATIPFGIGFYRPLAVFGSFLDFSNLTSAYIFYALMGILCFACHTAVLLAVYRHYWIAWGRSKDEGKLRMSEDAYGSYEPKN
ncbi:MAG: hypothetical protein IJ037_00010 [Clostridia bacterium]|nr:hypothetical protein [Clostridia bacterium]